MDVGGYRTDTVGEDMELVVRLHRHHRKARIPYRIRYLPDPICWTECPEDIGTLGRQRRAGSAAWPKASAGIRAWPSARAAARPAGWPGRS